MIFAFAPKANFILGCGKTENSGAEGENRPSIELQAKSGMFVAFEQNACLSVLVSWFWSVGFSQLVLVRWLWSVDFGLLILVLWLWSVDFGLLVLVCWFWSVGFGLLVLLCWFCSVGFALLVLLWWFCSGGFALVVLLWWLRKLEVREAAKQEAAQKKDAGHVLETICRTLDRLSSRAPLR